MKNYSFKNFDNLQKESNKDKIVILLLLILIKLFFKLNEESIKQIMEENSETRKKCKFMEEVIEELEKECSELKVNCQNLIEKNLLIENSLFISEDKNKILQEKNKILEEKKKKWKFQIKIMKLKFLKKIAKINI